MEVAHDTEHLEHPFLVTVRGVDHQYVDAGVQQGLRLLLGVTVDADGRRDPQLPGRVNGRLVERGAKRPLPGEDPDDAAVSVDNGRA